MSLQEGQLFLVILSNIVERGRTSHRSNFFHSQFQAICCKLNHSLHIHPDFESGVVKIQHGEETALTNTEKAACECLILSRPVYANESDSKEDSVSTSDESDFDKGDIVQAIKCAKQDGCPLSIYCNFVLLL